MKKEMTKENKLVRLDKKILEHLDTNYNIKSFSEWVEDKYKEEFMELVRETIKLERLLNEVESTKERIKLLRNSKDGTTLNELSYKWIKDEGIILFRDDNRDKQAVLRRFNNKFDLKINLRQFKMLIEKVEEETNGKL